MKRQFRLRRSAHFQRVRSSGNHYDGASLTLNVAPARQRTTRCGIVVARRIGGAVVRNRIKRRIREVLRIHYRFLRTNYDVVVIARSRELQTMPFSRLVELITQLLRRAGVWQIPEATPAVVTES
ncbi:MAG: ribonuclease P protein component [Chloroflexi bacterium]|nr:MAG: ribonuclease P protein component [Chloroflexota bacterium]